MDKAVLSLRTCREALCGRWYFRVDVWAKILINPDFICRIPSVSNLLASRKKAALKKNRYY